MATTTAPRKITRLDREEAARAAGSIDLGPAARGAAMVLVLLVLTLVLTMAVPNPARLGGPLQDANVVAGATMATIRKADGVVTMGVFVPWNAGHATVELEQIAAIGVEGDVELVEAGLLPSGVAALEPTRGFDQAGPPVVRVQDAPIAPGTGPLDGVQIAVALRGKGSVLGFVLRYREGDVTHHALLMSGAMLCGGSCDGRATVAERQRALARSLAGFLDAPPR